MADEEWNLHRILSLLLEFYMGYCHRRLKAVRAFQENASYTVLDGIDLDSTADYRIKLSFLLSNCSRDVAKNIPIAEIQETPYLRMFFSTDLILAQFLCWVHPRIWHQSLLILHCSALCNDCMVLVKRQACKIKAFIGSGCLLFV
jgi:hypothetical protein